MNVRDEDATTDSVIAEMTEAERKKIIEMKDDPRLYQQMSASIAPAVWGHEEIKRGILLMLLGGVHKDTGTGIFFRSSRLKCMNFDVSEIFAVKKVG